MRLIIPIVLTVVGTGTGLAAGHFFKPDANLTGAGAHDAVESHDVHGEPGNGAKETSHPDGYAESHTDISVPPNHSAERGDLSESEFVKLNNQFIVPILENGRMRSMVVLSLTLETAIGRKEKVYALEPKIRDGLLQVLFDHANAGGFDGTFTSGRALDHLRLALQEESQRIVGGGVRDVLVTDIARQDM
ncbi:flagellar basal body-associated FliL family protein [Tropicimonas marinistellae]|uniref:flagellar basal body-associated FliL family protein n=1 Tax=Tropicimonas marinistellae TaxID=1739787 RepID=UPI000836E138|nr:flagellar basal body-associated FliL family protein [Tropicimonas marinistellae]